MANIDNDLEESKKELEKGSEEFQQLADVCQSVSDELANQIAQQQPADVTVTSPSTSPAADVTAPEPTDTPTSPPTDAVAPEPEVEVEAAEPIVQLAVHHPAPVNRNGNYRISSEEMDLAELKVKIVCQEKNNMALKMELKCAELQVAAKEKIDAKKTRLIELLDAKVINFEKKNSKLLDMMEQMMKDKEQHTKRLIDATKNMEELGRKLSDSERIKRELERINRELKAMLENMEGKGTKLAQLAKEKVLKYKVENERMQKEIDGMKQQEADTAELTAGGGAGLWTCLEAVEELRRQLSSFVEAAAATASAGSGKEPEAPPPQEPTQSLAEALGGATRLCGELGSALDQLRQSAVDVVAISSRAVDLDVQNAELKKRLETQPEQQPAAAAGAGSDAADGSVDDVKKQLETKEKEITSLTEELQKLKAAIGQLVGFGAAAAAAATAAK